MTWPASDVGTTNADAGTDSPATFRNDVLDLIQKFNLLRNHVSAKWQSILSGGAYTPGVSVAFAASLIIDADASNVQEIADLTANVTSMTINNAAVGRTINIRFKQDSTGGRTVAGPAGSSIQGSINPAASKVSWLTLIYVNNGGSPRWEGSWMLLP